MQPSLPCVCTMPPVLSQCISPIVASIHLPHKYVMSCVSQGVAPLLSEACGLRT